MNILQLLVTAVAMLVWTSYCRIRYQPWQAITAGNYGILLMAWIYA